MIVAVSTGALPNVTLAEYANSPIMTLLAAYVAIEDSWSQLQVAPVRQALERYFNDEDPAIVAAATTRAAVLDTWWLQDDPQAFARASPLAQAAVVAEPDWVVGWLLLHDCQLAAGNLQQARDAALTLFDLEAIPTPEDDFDLAFEKLFTGRLSWTRRQARDLVDLATRRTDPYPSSEGATE